MLYGDLQFFDIILFAAIAGFIIYRLRSVLGKRTGFQKNNIENKPKQNKQTDIKQSIPTLLDNEIKLENVYKKVNNNRLKLWWPIFLKEEELNKLALEEIASLQWVSCVQNAKDALNNIKEEKIFHIKYEDFVTNPHMSIKNLSEFIGIKYNGSLLPSISKTNIGKGSKSLSFKQKKIILPLIINTMNENNYACSLND